MKRFDELLAKIKYNFWRFALLAFVIFVAVAYRLIAGPVVNREHLTPEDYGTAFIVMLNVIGCTFFAILFVVAIISFIVDLIKYIVKKEYKN